MQRQHFLELSLCFLHYFITAIVMGISYKAALADTNIIVFGHCHCLFLISQLCTSSSGSRLTEISCDIKYILSSHIACNIWSSKQPPSLSGDTEAHKNCCPLFSTYRAFSCQQQQEHAH